MGLRIRDIALLGVFAFATGIACGGRTSELLFPGPEGTGGDDAGSSSGGGSTSGGSTSGVSSSGVGSSSGFASSSGVGSSSGIGSSGVSSSTSSSGSFEDVACSPNAEKQGFASSLASCWGCVVMGCGPQMAACTADCACNAAVVSALDCVDSARDNVLGCFMRTANIGDSTTGALLGCLAQVGNECACGTTSTVPDASTCVASGSGSSGGSGECTSDFGEVCSGTTYKVVCSCPQNQCVCFGPSSTTIVDVNTCPLCPGLGDQSETAILDACGFPH